MSQTSNPATLPARPLRNELRWCLAQASAPITRPISRWVEEEIWLPNGPFAGERYRHDRHPVSRLWFGAVDSGRWTRFAGTGPTQNGKTLMLYVAPVLWHLFEIGETVVVGIPNMDMANDKWQQDFLPVIQASAFRDLLPNSGEGSKGGQVKRAITFKNGATLRFMSGGGSDKKRAGYTARVLAVTETDGLDEAGAASREADKIEQLEGRTLAFGRLGRRVYLECTVSIEKGRIWSEVKNGTDTRIVRPCPYCWAYVTPEREHLAGWQSAESEEAAAAAAFWSCPECGEAWTEAERRAAAARGVLLHRGQSIDKKGRIAGEAPQTQTFGLRWSAIDNPFVTAADLGAQEFVGRKSHDRDNAEKKMRQFIFCLPAIPSEIELTPLDPRAVERRASGLKKGIAPAEAIGAAVGIDTGKRKLHWDVKAVLPDGSLRVIDYGEERVESDSLGIYRGLIASFSALALFLERGWQKHDGGKLAPAQIWIDSGWHEHTEAVYALCARMNAGAALEKARYRATKGFGERQPQKGAYRAPQKRSGDVLYVGREFYFARVRRRGKLVAGVPLVHVNSDHWKSELHQRLAMPAEQPGAITLFDAPSPYAHAEYVAQLTAERQVEGEPTPRWEPIRRQNHFLDAGYLSTAAAWHVLDTFDRPGRQIAARARPSLAELASRGGNA